MVDFLDKDLPRMDKLTDMPQYPSEYDIEEDFDPFY